MIKLSTSEISIESAVLEKAMITLNSFFRENSTRLHQLRPPQPSVLALRPLLKPLRERFRGKCAYCETRTLKGEINHFRPHLVRSTTKFALSHLYYSWLTYAPENMMYACANCSRLKANQFPVEKNRAKLLSSVSECREQEDALLLDPTFDEPSAHIEFATDGICLARSLKGKNTIAALELNRPDLVNARRSTILTIIEILKELEKPTAQRKNASAALVTALLGFTDDSAEFAGAARSIISRRLQHLPEAGWIIQFRNEIMNQGWIESISTPTLAPHPSVLKRERKELGKFVFGKISRIVIDHFKGIEHITLNFPNTRNSNKITTETPSAMILLGENAVGKSTVLEAVSLALSNPSTIQELRLDPNKFIPRHETLASSGTPTVRLYFDGARAPAISLKIQNNRFSSDFDGTIPFIAYGPRRYYVRDQGKLRSEKLAHFISLFDPLATLEDPEEWLLRCSKSDFDAAARALREVLLLTQKDLITKISDPITKAEQLVVLTASNSLPIGDMSEGYRAVIATVIDIVRIFLKHYTNLETATGVVLIDEIDVHLHPRWKMHILKRLRTAFPGIQFIVTTHDPLCLRGAKKGEVTVMTREKHNVRTLSDLPNVESLSVQQLLTSEYFGLLSVEDPRTDEKRARHFTLSSKFRRTKAEETELSELRKELGKNLALGDSEEDQLLLKAIDQHHAERKEQKRAKEVLADETVKRMLSILKNGVDR